MEYGRNEFLVSAQKVGVSTAVPGRATRIQVVPNGENRGARTSEMVRAIEPGHMFVGEAPAVGGGRRFEQ